MLTDEQLGIMLAERLQDMVRDIEPSDRLLERIEDQADGSRASRPQRLSGRLRRRVLALSIPVAAVSAAAILTLAGSGVTPSFAVTRTSNGSIHITLNDIQGVTGANTRLHELGVTNIVVVPITTDCATHLALTYIGVGGTQGPTTVHLSPSQIAPGYTVLLAAEQISAGTIEFAFGRTTGPTPVCVAPGKTGVGLGNGAATGQPSSGAAGAALRHRRPRALAVGFARDTGKGFLA